MTDFDEIERSIAVELGAPTTSYRVAHAMWDHHQVKRCSRCDRWGDKSFFYADKNPQRYIPFTAQCRGCRDYQVRYAQYRLAARNRGLAFDIDRVAFYALVDQDCYYCGNRTAGSATGVDMGIDRYDSKRGYTDDNCVPCCKDCNLLMGDADEAGILGWAVMRLERNGIDVAAARAYVDSLR